MRINRLVILIALLTSACGYHLRGASDVPKGMKSVYLDGGSLTLREQFNEVLHSSSGQLAVAPENADVTIRILKDDIERRVLSLSQRGRSNEIELAGLLEFQLIDAKQGVLIGNEPVVFRRQYFNDQQDVIAKGNEETVIRKEMYKQAVRTIISRSRTVLESKGK